MKRVLLALTFMLVIGNAVQAQDIQLHYDMGKGRGYFTSTVEMFKPDSWGNTFFFIDMDYGGGGVEGISLAYWEIARAIKFWKSPVALHAEYNGGMGQFFTGDISQAYSINSAWLGGLEYSWNAKDFSRGLTLEAMYKYIRGKHNVSFQFTSIWYLNFANNRLSFSGFADLWREDMIFNPGTNDEITTKMVFLAEPQFWYNFNKNFAMGSEVELNVNFGGLKGFNVMPTIGAKVTF
ncbi:MAG TPA: DUF5020 family protein [Draconibacterium sp.]|nr:DUF5020 family protein [Draconibacterium sp.]